MMYVPHGICTWHVLVRPKFQHIYLGEVEFPVRTMMELAAKNIEESMYAQCDVDGNEYLLLEAFIDD